jgi:hypothetical protein
LTLPVAAGRDAFDSAATVDATAMDAFSPGARPIAV